MKEEEFVDIFKKYSKKYDIEVEEENIHSFYSYMKNLMEWNSKINLTAIKNEEDIILKHFIDSLIVNKYIEGNSGIDIGSGAGFPGIPLKILEDKYNLKLIDSVNKKVNFMNDTINKLNLKNILAIHARAEELGRNKEYREKFDFAISRAVANMSTLVEYLIPLVKVGGMVYCLKGPNIEEELEESKKAIKILGGKIEQVIKYNIEENERSLIIIKKEKNTEQTYPRKIGKPLSDPIR